ncbi:glycosyltransferase family 9 protein [Edaphobacter albus]|uniref:glycosyltransferase family 9 protein n=1 Tax=Edaphobacter sp. 4G125 TaxID=2763071 RepID=UPI001648B141|nr:glycosyltransferase family 9 protein [Edaphobacter sp. 4G125]QNI35361.1 glycosyltransferase family 9 protein [Edaphobacter sp. 4G125]
MSLKKTPLRLSARALLSVERLVRPAPAISPASILVLEYLLPLGCCIHLTPLYQAIKRSVPESTITVATRGLGLSVLRHNTFIDYLIETPDPLVTPLKAAQSLRAELSRRSLRPELILTGASDQRTRIAVMAMLTAPAIRGGFTIHNELYHRPLIYDSQRSLIDNNLRMAEFVSASPEHREPRVFFSEANAAAAQKLIQAANPEARPLVVFVTQNSGGQLTGWHTSRFVEVIQHTYNKLGCAVVYVGTDRDHDSIEEIRKAAGGVGVSLAGKTSVTELAALLALADAAVSLDTGTMHVGRCVGLPMVVIGPSWQKPIEWLPLELPQVRILRGPDRDRKDIPANYKLDEVEAPAVIVALEDLLTKYPANAASRQQRLNAGISTIDHLQP